MGSIEDKSFIVATHVWADGPGQALKKYMLLNKAKYLLWITSPLMYDKRLNGNGFEIYEKGTLVKKYYKKIKKKPTFVSYILDLFYIIWFTLGRGKYDLYIGCDNLNAFAGWILRKIGKVKKCIYYVVDYTPQRFPNKLLNWAYHKVETFCAIHCDETWNLSHRMIEAREKFKGVRKERCGTQKVVPVGIWYGEIKRYSIDEINKHQVVFVGHILKKQGVQYVLDAIPSIVRNIPDFKFLIIGDGEYLNNLKNRAKELKIEKYVEFTGYVEEHREINEMIAKSTIAVALYEKDDTGKNWTYYSDPGKLKVYLGAGVPVLITDVPYNAKTIEGEKCGKIVGLDSKEISNVLVNMIKDEETLRTYKRNATIYASQFDWNLIFKSIL